jgi:hypothetical protein
MREATPSASRGQRALAVQVILMSMEAIGRTVSEQARPMSEVDRFASAAADMYCAYLERLNG